MEDASSLRTAGYWRRVLGGIPDAAVVAGCCVASRLMPNDALAATLAFVLVMAYLIGCHWYRGQSLGKWIAGTRVVTTDGRPMSLLRSSVRALAQIGSTVGLLYLVVWATARLLQLAYQSQKESLPWGGWSSSDSCASARR